MTVYVDDMFQYPMGRFGRMKMSHMVADTEDELHAMAARIGIARKWFQDDHYDVSITKRDLAIAAGAVAISLRDLSKIAVARRFELAKRKRLESSVDIVLQIAYLMNVNRNLLNGG